MADNVVRTERVEPSAPLILSEGITRAAESPFRGREGRLHESRGQGDQAGLNERLRGHGYRILQLINPRVGQARDSQSGLEEDRI